MASNKKLQSTWINPIFLFLCVHFLNFLTHNTHKDEDLVVEVEIEVVVDDNVDNDVEIEVDVEEDVEIDVDRVVFLLVFVCFHNCIYLIYRKIRYN